MKLQILGAGCAKCKALTSNVEAAVISLGVQAEIEKVEDVQQIIKFGVMMTPALAIDGQVKFAGKIATVDDIKKLLG